jgi:hypothetical protein
VTRRAKSKKLAEGALFGTPPLLEGENEKAYDQFLVQISATVQPADILEEIWVRNYLDLFWEETRLRRLKTSLMTSSAYKGLEELLRPLIGSRSDPLSFRHLVDGWAAHDASAIERADEILTSANMTMNDVMAQTLSVVLNDIERIDRMIAVSEVRRSAILREIDRHREALGQRLRRAVQQVGDDQLRVVESTSIDGTNTE